MPYQKLNAKGELLPGVHLMTLEEVEVAFGQSNVRRRMLMEGLVKAVSLFKGAYVTKIFIDGSFTSSKEYPNDIDGCWSAVGVLEDKLDPRFWDFESVEDFERKRQEVRKEFGIDFFIAELIEGGSGKPFPEFFQTNRDGEVKGIIQINLDD